MQSRSIEDAAKKIPNHFELVLVAAQRARELKRGYQPHITSNSGAMLTALAEIEGGHITDAYLVKVGTRLGHRR